MSRHDPDPDTHPQKRQLLSRLDPALVKRLKVHAAERDVTVSSVIEDAVGRYLARFDVPDKGTS